MRASEENEKTTTPFAGLAAAAAYGDSTEERGLQAKAHRRLDNGVCKYLLWRPSTAPLALNSQRHPHYVHVMHDGLTAEYVARGGYTDVGVLQAEKAIPKDCAVFYFEVEILSCSPTGPARVCIGLTTRSAALTKHPGAEPYSIGYYSEDGRRLGPGLPVGSTASSAAVAGSGGAAAGSGAAAGTGAAAAASASGTTAGGSSAQPSRGATGLNSAAAGGVSGGGGPSSSEPLGVAYGKGDVVGCGVHHQSRNVFFTKNGVFVGVAAKAEPHIEYFPAVGMQTHGERIRCNFRGPFLFDLNALLQCELLEERQHIQADADAAAAVNQTALIEVVRSYLLHAAFTRTLQAFEKELHARNNQSSTNSPELHSRAAAPAEPNGFNSDNLMAAGDDKKASTTGLGHSAKSREAPPLGVAGCDNNSSSSASAFFPPSEGLFSADVVVAQSGQGASSSSSNSSSNTSSSSNSSSSSNTSSNSSSSSNSGVGVEEGCKGAAVADFEAESSAMQAEGFEDMDAASSSSSSAFFPERSAGNPSQHGRIRWPRTQTSSDECALKVAEKDTAKMFSSGDNDHPVFPDTSTQLLNLSSTTTTCGGGSIAATARACVPESSSCTMDSDIRTSREPTERSSADTDRSSTTTLYLLPPSTPAAPQVDIHKDCAEDPTAQKTRLHFHQDSATTNTTTITPTGDASSSATEASAAAVPTTSSSRPLVSFSFSSSAFPSTSRLFPPPRPFFQSQKSTPQEAFLLQQQQRQAATQAASVVSPFHQACSSNTNNTNTTSTNIDDSNNNTICTNIENNNTIRSNIDNNNTICTNIADNKNNTICTNIDNNNTICTNIENNDTICSNIDDSNKNTICSNTSCIETSNNSSNRKSNSRDDDGTTSSNNTANIGSIIGATSNSNSRSEEKKNSSFCSVRASNSNTIGSQNSHNSRRILLISGQKSGLIAEAATTVEGEEDVDMLSSGGLFFGEESSLDKEAFGGGAAATAKKSGVEVETQECRNRTFFQSGFFEQQQSTRILATTDDGVNSGNNSGNGSGTGRQEGPRGKEAVAAADVKENAAGEDESGRETVVMVNGDGKEQKTLREEDEEDIDAGVVQSPADLRVTPHVTAVLVASLHKRKQLRQAIEEGRGQEATEMLEREFPLVLHQKSFDGIFAVVLLLTQQMIDFLRPPKRDVHAAIKWMRSKLTGLMQDAAPHIRQAITECCGLLAYEQPETSELGAFFDLSRRMVTATAINRCVLKTHLRVPCWSSLEVLLRHLVACRQLIRECCGNRGPIPSSRLYCYPPSLRLIQTSSAVVAARIDDYDPELLCSPL